MVHHGATPNVHIAPFKVRNNRKPILYRTIKKSYLDQYYDSDLYYDSDDYNYYDDSHDDRDLDTKNMYWDGSADEFVENHW